MKEKRKHTEDLHFRVTPEQRQIFERAAELSGLTLTSWVRFVLIDAAGEKVLTEAGKKE